MSYVQLLSPIFSAICAFVRIYSIGSWDLFPDSKDMSEHTVEKCQVLFAMTMINVFLIGFCIIPIVDVVLTKYYDTDKGLP